MEHNGTWKRVGCDFRCNSSWAWVQTDFTGLQQKAAAFADAVLIPLAEFFQVVHPGFDE